MSAGCSNHGCWIREPAGIGTNGLCHCLDPLGHQNARLVMKQISELRRLKAKADKEEPYQNVLIRLLIATLRRSLEEHGYINHDGTDAKEPGPHWKDVAIRAINDGTAYLELK